MADIQQETDVAKARERLEDVARQKEGGTDMAPPSDPIRGESYVVGNHDSRDIRPVKAKPKKKKFGRKLKEAMFGDIGDGSITEHIFFNIFIPSLKRVISDMGNTALNMALGLDPKTRVISSSHAANARTYRDRNYNQTGLSGYSSRRESVSDYRWDEETAKDIYNQVSELIDRFGYASLEDVYSIMDKPDKIRSTDRNWGYTSTRNIEVYPVDMNGEDWVVSFPPAKPL